jgi:hypothetical protein
LRFVVWYRWYKEQCELFSLKEWEAYACQSSTNIPRG